MIVTKSNIFFNWIYFAVTQFLATNLFMSRNDNKKKGLESENDEKEREG
jgi:hypothetical protein